jgi:hypothetical protein
MECFQSFIEILFLTNQIFKSYHYFIKQTNKKILTYQIILL